MKQSNRLLLIFGAVVGVLAIVAIALVLTRGQDEVALLSEDDPAGVVQRYLRAIQDDDYEGAVKYLSASAWADWYLGGPVPGPPGPELVARLRGSIRSDVSWRAVLDATRLSVERAEVDITAYVFRPGAPFSNPVRTHRETFVLQRENDAWRIISPVELWWLY
ncbi:MAG: hypothetical protein AB1603_00275 [Chloroflexota bacterium]